MQKEFKPDDVSLCTILNLNSVEITIIYREEFFPSQASYTINLIKLDISLTEQASLGRIEIGL